jgi:glycosyltransferase involved in cell wall biosynthesis
MTTPNGLAPSSTLTASVIIPAYNAAATLEACLQALLRQTVSAESYEIIVVDDASTDSTAAIATSNGARIVTLPVNQGRSHARNAGAQAATAPILLFTDADCEPFADWIEQMLAPFERDAAVVGVKGTYRNKQHNLVARFTQLELEDKYDTMAQQDQIAFIDTYSAGFRRDVFLANDGFDPALTYSLLEDQDFSFRLAAQGHKMVFAPDAHVFHRHLTNPVGYYKRKFVIGRSKVTVLRRHPDRISADSRTPLSLKVQFVLAVLLTPLLPLAFFWRPARYLVAILAAAFDLSTVPFWIKGLRRDVVATLVAPVMLPLRAFGLAHGYVIGTLFGKKIAPNTSESTAHFPQKESIS